MKIFKLLIILSVFIFASCEKDDYNPSPFDLTTGGVIVLNEGQFNVGNSSISYMRDTVVNYVFKRANNIELGDVPTTVANVGNRMYITLSNSGKISIIDPHTSILTGKITGLNSPRYISVVSSTKIYVSSLWLNEIYIINPQTETVTGSIKLEADEKAENFVTHGGYVYTNCWSSNNRKLLKIDPATDKVVAKLEVGSSPNGLVIDKNNNIWTIIEGGWTPDWSAHLETPKLVCVSTSDFKVIASQNLGEWDMPQKLSINAAKDKIYYINKDVYEVDITKPISAGTKVISAGSRNLYALGVSPSNGEIFVADAIDYTQPGVVYRYSSTFAEKVSFKVGVNPASFYFPR